MENGIRHGILFLCFFLVKVLLIFPSCCLGLEPEHNLFAKLNMSHPSQDSVDDF